MRQVHCANSKCKLGRGPISSQQDHHRVGQCEGVETR